MKKFLILILSLFMVLGFTACGLYVPPQDSDVIGGIGGGNNPGEGNTPGEGNNPGGSTSKPGSGDEESGEPFTVTLTLNGAVYTNTAGIKAQWTGKYSVYDAEFVDGVATYYGLDGEYHVTLSAIPQEPNKTFTYDSNGYTATNRRRNIVVELLEILTPASGSGRQRNSDGSFAGYELRNLGTYRATINSASHEVWYYYRPMADGWYTITSWVDTTANLINPRVTTYNGNVAAGFYVQDEVVTKGGSEGTFTKNFRFEVKINWDEVGNTKIFTVAADIASGVKYPVTVDFTVKYEGEYIRDDLGDPIYATGPFYTGEKPAGTFWYTYWDTYNILMGSRVKLNPDDHYYHLYDESEYAATNGWGPLLFVKLTKDCEVVQTYNGETHIDGGFNWNGLNDGLVSCLVGDLNYAYMITANTDDDGVFHDGYNNYCNSDGVHPVTEELKTFLQGYATREWLFDDGEGWAENQALNGVVALSSAEDDQWLFACGYYRT